MRLAGKVALVTGGYGGIGRACAEVFAEHGARVVAADIREQAPAYHAAGIAYAVLDVRSPQSWDAVFEHPTLAVSGVDIVVNAAGIGGAGSIADVSLEVWNDVIAVNQTGVLLGSQRAVRSMLAHGRGGSIVNVSSIWGSVATAGFAAYHASKGAVTVLTRNAAVSYATDGIRANCVHPGLIDTPMSQGSPAEFNRAVIEATPMRRIGSPREVALGVLFLAGDESSYVTGSSVFIDGGFSAV